MVRNLRRGQAELIGGLIVVSVIILIVIPLILNMLTSSTTTDIRAYSQRLQFEIDRSSEKLLLINNTLTNPSPISISIVRIWLMNKTPVDINPPVEIPSGSNIGIDSLWNKDELDALVTSRGRVFKISELIPPTITITPIQYPPLGIIGSQVVGGSNLFERNVSIDVTCTIGRTPCTYPIAGFYYNNTWYVNRNGWVPASNANINICVDQSQYTDLDENKAHELVVLTNMSRTCFYVPTGNIKANNLVNSYLFKNFTYINESTSIIVIYVKSVVKSEEAQSVVVLSVSLIKTDDNTKNVTSYASLSSAKVTRAGDLLQIYEGYVMFPIMQFHYFRSIIAGSPGWYDLNITVEVVMQENVYIWNSLEYVVISAY